MAFWGIEVKPRKPYTHQFDNMRGRLHISQATLGIGPSTEKVLVQCIVGDKRPILLCALIPNHTESCPLDLEFEEEDDVIFSVLGPQSAHLTGYYLGNGHECGGDSDDTDSYGEDIAESDTERSTECNTEEEYEDDFFVDSDLEMFPPSPRMNSGVVIEEILDDEHTANGDGHHKRVKKKYQKSDSDDDGQRQIVVKDVTRAPVLESEDEDGFPITPLPKTKPTVRNTRVEEKSDKKIAKENKKAENRGDQVTDLKRKIDTIQDDEAKREFEHLNDSSMPSSEIGHENAGKSKKKKKEQAKEGKTLGVEDGDKNDVQKEDKLPNDRSLEIDGNIATNEDHVEVKKKKKKKKKKKSKAQESDKNANTDEEGKKGSVVEIDEKKTEVKPSQTRTFSNGLVIEELEMGKPDGKKASPGNKVSMHYIGKLKKDGQIFDSNVGSRPFKFRLGVGEVIKGWDIGVNGMRIGDKRRLTIPPSMGYGSQGAGGKIPPNAWLVFEVVLVDVR